MLRQLPNRAEDELATQTSGLHDHLLHDHGHTEGELEGLPLADLHRLEHVEHEMGLHHLSHRHPAPLGSRTR
ncbi:hypothetical protein [Modestobacter marinus]|uniref:hypothetical protein n=1 Tax=Modestobacter marinus TaxID=477641 RepID=UPI001C93C514|nr:hypothetical protein [Modestobacter marinus]